MREGVNGPYYSTIFVSPGVGLHTLKVYTDQGKDITEANENNNMRTKVVWFST